MKKPMVVLMMLAMTAFANAEIVQNYDFSSGDVSWTHVGYGGTWIYNDGYDDIDIDSADDDDVNDAVVGSVMPPVALHRACSSTSAVGKSACSFDSKSASDA